MTGREDVRLSNLTWAPVFHHIIIIHFNITKITRDIVIQENFLLNPIYCLLFENVCHSLQH